MLNKTQNGKMTGKGGGGRGRDPRVALLDIYIHVAFVDTFKCKFRSC